MSGSKIGGMRAAKTNMERYGRDYFKRLGAIGGKAENPRKGFGSSGKQRMAGKLGGMVSIRGGKRTPEERLKIRQQFYANLKQLTAIHEAARESDSQ